MKVKKNAIEWTVFAISVAIIAVTAWLLLDDAVSMGERHVNLRAEAGKAMKTAGGYAVPIIVTNDGDATAEQARIEMVLVADGKEVEKSELTVAFVPRKSRREGVVVFRNDPACCRLITRTVAYEKP